MFYGFTPYGIMLSQLINDTESEEQQNKKYE